MREDGDRLRAGLGHWHRQSRHARAGRRGPSGPSQNPGRALQCGHGRAGSHPLRRQRQAQQCRRVVGPAGYRRGAGRRGQPEGGRLSGQSRRRSKQASGSDCTAERSSVDRRVEAVSVAMSFAFTAHCERRRVMFGGIADGGVFLVAVFLILLVLVQRGRGGGLTGALGGMGGQSAFGTKAGDLFTRITIVAAAVWICSASLAVKMLQHAASSSIIQLGTCGRPAPALPGQSGLPSAGASHRTSKAEPTAPAMRRAADGRGRVGQAAPAQRRPTRDAVSASVRGD